MMPWQLSGSCRRGGCLGADQTPIRRPRVHLCMSWDLVSLWMPLINHLLEEERLERHTLTIDNSKSDSCSDRLVLF